MSTVEEYSEILTRLLTELTSCIPAEWSHGALTIESDGVRINYKLKAEDQPGNAVISEKLRDLIDELYVRMAQHGNAWVEANIIFTRTGGEITFDTSFKHDTPEPPPETARRPWWKLGKGRAREATKEEKSSTIIISIAEILMKELQKNYPGWQRAFFRFNATDDHYGSKGSYQTNEGVLLFDPFKHDKMFDKLNQLGVELRSVLHKNEKRFCVFLLTVNSDFSYKFKFEYEDPGKWAISKMDGATGIPEGIE